MMPHDVNYVDMITPHGINVKPEGHFIKNGYVR